MKTVSEEFAAHLRSETTTLCQCWLLTRKDGVVMGFTDHDRDLEFAGVSFECASGFEASQLEELGALVADNGEIAGALSSQRITQEDIGAGKFDGAVIELYLVNWDNPVERLLQNRFELGEITTQGNIFKADMKSLSARLDETMGRSFVRRCDADFGDQNCGINLADDRFRVEAVVSEIANASTLVVSGADQYAANWFTNGRFEFLTGKSAGTRGMIAQHGSRNGKTIVQLWQPLSGMPVIGDRISLVAGCDKTFKTCRSIFSNALNFRGFPHVPGNDFVSSYAANSSQFDGGPLFP